MDTDNLKLLNKKIELLKHNIQDIINKQSNSDDDTLEEKKQKIMSELNESMVQLKQVKNKIARNNEYKKVTRANDSMLYHRVKNKPNSVELMQELKHNREIAQVNFEKMKLIESKYNEKELCENLKFPGFLFLSKEITDKYGMCPFIKLNDTDDILDILNKREEWLNNQNDKGELYYKLYDKIIEKTSLKLLNENKLNLDNQFNKIHDDFLTDQQKKLYDTVCEDIKEYINHPIKTKKLKDKFKIIINNVTNLVIETQLKINEYITLFYDLYIPVNIPHDKVSNTNLQFAFITNVYDKALEDYKIVLDKIITNNKFILNTENHLKQALYEYIYNTDNVENNQQTLKIHQVGKYFKKWSLLSDEEKADRYESFSEFFVNKYLVEPKLLETNETSSKEDMEQKINLLKLSLKQLLIDESKNIKYKNIKWDAKRGYLLQINCLKYNNDKQEFYIVKETETDVKNNVKIKRPSSVRTILNKENEKIINEEIVLFIISAKNNNKIKLNTGQEDIKKLKDECTELLKTKMKLKRLTVNDKLQIYKKFDDILNVILNNTQ